MKLERRLERLKRREKREVDKVVSQVIELISSLKGGWVWLDHLETRGKNRLERGIERIYKETLLGEGFKKALGEDLIGEDGIPLMESKVYRYLKREWFRGDVGRLVRELSEWKRIESREDNIKEIGKNE